MTDDRRRAAQPLALLALFLFVIRVVPELARPASPPDDCERISPTEVAALERCLTVRPDDVELLVDLADGYERNGDRARAAATYRRALAIDPSDGELRRRLDALLTRRPAGQ